MQISKILYTKEEFFHWENTFLVRGMATVSMDGPGQGETGRNGTYPANQAARTADVILALGTRFDDRATSSWLPGYTYAIPPTKLIHVDIDPQELGRNYPVSVGIFFLVAGVRSPV